MRIMTDTVHPDEPCWGYYTGPKQVVGYSEEENPRMIEQVFVIRGDAIACYERDFGCADDFMYIPPLIMGFYDDGANPVGLLMEFGERHRHDDRWARRMREYRESSTLFADIVRQEEQKHLIINNRSSLGPYVNVQRNGWSHATSARRWNDERRRRTRRITVAT